MIKFGVWSPTQADFVQSWITAGILEYDAEARLQYLSPYRGQMDTNMDSWPGVIVKTPAVIDPQTMEEITPAVLVPGWHTNVRVYGPELIAQFTAGLDQYDVAEDGTRTLKSVWDRTHAAAVFGLTYREADPSIGFPAGYTNGQVVYADINDFSSPANVF